MDKLTADQYFESQAEFNKWLHELTDNEKEHIKSMLQEYALQIAEDAFEAGKEKHTGKLNKRNLHPDKEQYLSSLQSLKQ